MVETKGAVVITRWMAVVPTCAAAMMLSGCVQVAEPPPIWAQNVSAAEAVGALAGGALGGYLGSQFGAGGGALAMTGLGVAAGAALGREIGSSLEAANRPNTRPYVVLPYGYCLRQSNGSPSAPTGSQSPEGWSITAC
jgi:Glycine zipper 2TM domain